MPLPSQRSFDVRFVHFNNGINLLLTFPDYAPTNTLITNAALAIHVGDVQTKNAAVVSAETPLKNKRDERQLKAFRIKDTNPQSVQSLIENILSYVGGELSKKAAAYKQIHSMLRKIKPTYPKKDKDAPRGAGKSPMEKSFASLSGIGEEVISICSSLGASYAPTNANIQIPNFTNSVNDLKGLNTTIAVLLKDFGIAVADRKDVYDGQNGLLARTIMIKDYLAGFLGGKSNVMYVEFSQAIKGV